MRLPAATGTGLLLFAASLGLLIAANEALDTVAIAGGIGVVISGALLGLTFLTWRWRGRGVSFVATDMAATGVYADIADMFEAGDAAGLEDAAAV